MPQGAPVSAGALQGELLAGAALCMFSANILVLKSASTRLSTDIGFAVAVFVNVLCASMLFGIELATRNAALAWNGRSFLLFVLAGVFSTYLGRWFFFEAIVRFGPAKASIFQISSPAFAAIIAWVALGETFSSKAMLGMAVTVAGLVLCGYVPPRLLPAEAAADGALTAGAARPAPLAAPATGVRAIVFFGLGGALAYAIGSVLRAQAVRSWNEPIFGALVGASAGLLLHAALNRGNAGLIAKLRSADRRGLLTYSASGVLTICAQICAIASFRYIPVSLSSLIVLCTPVLVVPASYVLFKNRDGITWRTWAGGLLTMLGISAIVLR
jgi:drug/metabolite transporter (DMT)-like permease